MGRRKVTSSRSASDGSRNRKSASVKNLPPPTDHGNAIQPASFPETTADMVSPGTTGPRYRTCAGASRIAHESARLASDWLQGSVHMLRAAHGLPLLLGVGMGFQWLGAERLVAPALEPSASAPFLLGCVLLLALAVGPHIPEWLLAPVAMCLRRRAKGAPPIVASGHPRTAESSTKSVEAPDSFRRLALAVLCGAAGSIALLQLALAEPALRFLDLMLRTFFWTELTLTLVRGVWLAALLGSAWCMYGMILVVLGRLRSASTPVAPVVRSVSGEALIGAAIGSIAGSMLLDRHLSGQQLYLMGVLQPFVMAMICVRSSRGASASVERIYHAPPPELSGADEWLGVGALVTTALAAALCIEGLWGCRLLLSPDSRGDLGWILLVAGVAFLATSSRRKGGTCLSDAGHLLWIAGLILGAGLWMHGGVSELVFTGLAAAGLGGSLGVLEHDVLARMSGERASFALVATAGFAGTAVGLAVGHWWASALLGPCGVLVLGILCVLATAGFVQIYAQDAPTHLRRARLGLVFALLAAVMLGMPPEARRWSHREQALRVNERNAGAVDASLATMAAHAGSICWIAPRYPENLVLPSSGVPIQFMPTFGSGFRTETAASSGIWMVSRRYYGLIYQCWPDRVERFPQYTQDWLRRLFAAAAPFGTVCIDVPRSQFGEEAQRVILSTFVRAAGHARVHHEIALGPYGECLRLQASFDEPDDVVRTFDRRSGTGPDNSATGPNHSLRRDQLTTSWEASPIPVKPSNPGPSLKMR